ncbi:hypothetical protein NCAS_0E00120 [Naumovozyma castellii]|uniref:Sir1 ORC-binding domain-containing protein n=1 Tax=Naumovozyma castellii TaxID=27288 RepID=G0VF17_NAUCA|nr:hypothetical protein NCAS_0E00120 [Naumovozyma castellii CBS 4309]CCC70082.1 hypothetical protein NCAS_0E00120 [Naumovozyma castellii CBS 4309]
MASAFLGQTKKNRIYNWAKFHSLKPHSSPPSHPTKQPFANPTTTMFYISDNVSVVDGFVVLTIEKEGASVRKVVKKFHPKSKLFLLEERTKLANYALVDLDEYHTAFPGSDLVPVPSSQLFSVCTTSKRLFYTTPDGFRIVNSKTPDRHRRCSQEYTVIPVVYKDKPTKYLYLRDETHSTQYLLADVTVDRDIVHSKDSSFFEQEMNVGEIVFTENDLSVLAGFQQYKAQFAEDIYSYFSTIYSEVRSRYHRRPYLSSFHRPGYGETFPKDLQIPTIQKYSSMGSAFLFLAEVFPQLSFAEDFTCEHEQSPPKSIDAIASWFTFKLLPGSDNELWYLLVRICCYNWQDTSVAYPALHTLNSFRQLVDSIRALATYSVLYRFLHAGAIPGDSTADEIFFTKKSEPWTWTNVMYHKLTVAYQNYTKFNVRVCKPDALLISGKKFSRSYIREFYANVKERFESNLSDLRQYFDKVLSVQAVADATLNSPTAIDVAENRIKTKNSLLLLINETALANVVPDFKPNVTIDSQEVARLVADMGVCVMWMIYFSATGPYRFPDMLILKYAGNQRNLFVDPESRCLDIITEYSKNREGNPMCKTLDKVTSDHLFYYIIVARNMLKHAVGTEYADMKRDLFNETNGAAEESLLNGYLARSIGDGISADDMDPVRYSRNVVNSFVFVDCTSHSLMHYARFSAFLNLYPMSVNTIMIARAKKGLDARPKNDIPEVRLADR